MTPCSGKTNQQGFSRRNSSRKCALTFVSAAVAVALAVAAMPAAAVGHLAGVDIVSRRDAAALAVHPGGGRYWVVGAPGAEYSVRVCNATDARMLAVMSVDGVNVITGDTAGTGQSGYVLGARECADISGWRKSMTRTAAFYFTELPDAYAARTGRPENVGVIGVALFPEKPAALAHDNVGKLAADARAEAPAPAARQDAAGAGAESRAAPAGPADRDRATERATAQFSRLGTGHGRSETSPMRMVAFERASPVPAETIAIHYDRRENLVAMGILPPPHVAQLPNPFPAWTPPRFTPDPPAR